MKESWFHAVSGCKIWYNVAKLHRAYVVASLFMNKLKLNRLETKGDIPIVLKPKMKSCKVD